MSEGKGITNNFFHKVRKLQREQKWEEAIALYQDAIALNPNFAWYHHNLGEVLERFGRINEAKVAYRQAIELNSRSALSYYKLGRLLAEGCRLDQSIEVLSAGLKLKPNYHKYHKLLKNVVDKKLEIQESRRVVEEELDILLTKIAKTVDLDVVKPATAVIENAQLLSFPQTIGKMIALTDDIMQKGGFTPSKAPGFTRKLFELYQLIVNVDSLKSQAFAIYRLMVSLESICGFIKSAKVNDSYLTKIASQPSSEIIIIDTKKFSRLKLPLKILLSCFVDEKLLDIESSKVVLELLTEVADFSSTDIFTALVGASRQADSLLNDSKLISENCDSLNSANKHEERNLKYLRANKIFWSDIFVSERLCIPLLGANHASQSIYPLGTIAMSSGGYGFFAYPFLLGPMVIAPLYAEWMSILYGLAILDLNSNKLVLLCQPHLVSEIQDTFAKSLIELISKSTTSSPLAIPKFSTILGFRVNFGHTIINETSCLDLMKHKSAHNKCPNILIGDYDFLDTFSLVKSFGCQVDILSQFKCENLDSYVLPNHVACPLTTQMATSSALSLVRRGHIFSSEENPKALYFVVDYRKGSRYFVNIRDVLNLLIESVINLDVFIIIDGLTQVNLPLKKAEQNRSLHTAVEEVLSASKTKNELEVSQKLIITDGLTFPEKIETFSKYNIKAAFAPYGSSLMIPIYILNVPIYIFGTEIFRQYERQLWHITRYCHKERILKENVVKSSSLSNQGYQVMLSDFKTKLEKVISSL